MISYMPHQQKVNELCLLGHYFILCADAVRSLQSRKMANWIKPKFENGDAEPHGERQIIFLFNQCLIFSYLTTYFRI